MCAFRREPVPASRLACRARASRTASAQPPSRAAARLRRTVRLASRPAGRVGPAADRPGGGDGAAVRSCCSGSVPARSRIRTAHGLLAASSEKRAGARVPAPKRPPRSVLERLTQRVECARRELRQLVAGTGRRCGRARPPRSQRASVAEQAACARSRAAARGTVARGSARSRTAAREAADARDLQRLVAIQGRQDPRHPPRQHRLAAAGRAAEQACCGRRLRRAAVRARRSAGRAPRRGPALPARPRCGLGRRSGEGVAGAPPASTGGASQLAPPAPPQAVDERGLARARARQREPRQPARRVACATARAPRAGRTVPSSASSPNSASLVEPLGGELPARGEDRASERQVEARPRLTQVARGEIGGDPSGRELVAAVADRAAHPFARLANRLHRRDLRR